MSSHYFKMWKWVASTSVDLVMDLAEWATIWLHLPLFINSINTNVVAAVTGIKRQRVFLSIHLLMLRGTPCAHVHAQTIPAHVSTGIVWVYIDRRWLHAGVHMHVCMHGLSQDPGPSPSSPWPDPAMNSAALAIHTYHLPNAFPVVSPNAQRRETPRNAQSQRGTSC